MLKQVIISSFVFLLLSMQSVVFSQTYSQAQAEAKKAQAQSSFSGNWNLDLERQSAKDNAYFAANVASINKTAYETSGITPGPNAAAIVSKMELAQTDVNNAITIEGFQSLTESDYHAKITEGDSYASAPTNNYTLAWESYNVALTRAIQANTHISNAKTKWLSGETKYNEATQLVKSDAIAYETATSTPAKNTADEWYNLAQAAWFGVDPYGPNNAIFDYAAINGQDETWAAACAKMNEAMEAWSDSYDSLYDGIDDKEDADDLWNAAESQIDGEDMSAYGDAWVKYHQAYLDYSNAKEHFEASIEATEECNNLLQEVYTILGL